MDVSSPPVEQPWNTLLELERITLRWRFFLAGGILVTQLMLGGWMIYTASEIRHGEVQGAHVATLLQNEIELNRGVVAVLVKLGKGEQELQEQRYRALSSRLDVIDKSIHSPKR